MDNNLSKLSGMDLHIGIMKYINLKRNMFKSGQTKEIINEITRLNNEQLLFEPEYVNSKKVCKQDTSKISGLKSVELKQKINTEFYNVKLMELFKCMIDVIIFPNENETTTNERERIHRFLHNFKQFGTPSANGTAMKGYVGEHSTPIYNGETIVVKVPKDGKQSNELMHEAAVGLTLNVLREKIPNFCYFYDTFKCSSPIIDPRNKKVLSFCTSKKNELAYAVYENIDDSLPFMYWAQDLVKMYDTREISWNQLRGILRHVIHPDTPVLKLDKLNNVQEVEAVENIFTNLNDTLALQYCLYAIQSTVALAFSNEKVGYTHYDNHYENNLIRKYSNDEFYIEYEVKGKTMYVLSPGCILTFIDYGMSHIKTEQKDIGIIDRNGSFWCYDVVQNADNIMYDVYKSLCFMAHDCIILGSNSKLMNIYQELLSFFYGKLNMEELKKLLHEQMEFRFPFPEQLKNRFNIYDYLDHLINITERMFPKYKGKILTGNPQGPIFGCNGNCKSYRQNMKEIGVGISKIPTFYDIFSSKGDEQQKVISNFVKNTKQVIHNEESELQSLLNTTPSVFYPLNGFEQSVNPMKHVELHYIFLNSVAETYQNYYNLTNFIKYAQNASQIQLPQDEHNEIIKMISDARSKHNKMQTYLRTIKQHLQNTNVSAGFGNKQDKLVAKIEECLKLSKQLINEIDV